MLCSIVAALVSLSALAGDRPHQSVGLVLSGGGAKGIAHIGVIKALEENDIPIDYITGTSMGAIVGGLYAAGYTPEEMMRLLESKGFGYWSTGQIDEKLIFNFFRRDPSPAALTIPINRGDSAQVTSLLPSSMISPLPMNFAFMDLFAAYTAQCGGDFDKLFVPFRCVCSDVYAKRKIVCSDGDLGDAIRASMSFPTVFQPIEMDGVLVYDGGIYDNFPVDVMREDFAPSIMIGSDVSSPETKPRAGDLIDQLEDMIMQKSDYNIPPEEGIRLRFDLERFGLLDFPKAREIYQVGYDYAMSMMDSIKVRVITRIPAEVRTLRRNVFKSATPYVRFDSVSVAGGKPQQDAYIKYLFTKNRRDTFGLEDARLSYYQAISSGNLRNLVPHAIYNDSTGLFALDMKATLKTNFRVGLGTYITSSTSSMIYLSAGYSTLSFHSVEANVNGWIGQSYMAGVLNGRMHLPTHIPSAFEGMFVVSKQKFHQSDDLFYEDKLPTFVIDNECFGRLSYGWAMGRSGKGSLGVSGGTIRNSFYPNDIIEYSNVGRDRTRYNLGQVRLAFDRNTLNNQIFPTAGARYAVTINGQAGKFYFDPAEPAESAIDENVLWGQLHGSAHNYFELGKHFSLGTNVEAVVSTRSLIRDYDAAIVNATPYKPTPSSYNSFAPSFRANTWVAAAAKPIWRFSDALQLRGDFHVFLPYRRILNDRGQSRYGRVFADPRFFGEVAAVYNFPFQAALSVYGNYSDTPGDRWNVGISFGAFFLAPKLLE